MVRHHLSLALLCLALGVSARGEEGPLPATATSPELRYSQCLKQCALDFEGEEEDAAFCRITCDNQRAAAGEAVPLEEPAFFPGPPFPPPPPPGPSIMELLVLMMLLSPPKPEPPRILPVPIPVPYGMASDPFQTQRPGMSVTPWGELSGPLPPY